MRNDDAQNKPEDLLMRFDVDQPAGAREGGMIGAAFVESNAQKVADAERIGGPPGDTAFGIDALEIADEEGAEVDARGEAGPAHFIGVELLAGSLGPRRSPKVDHFCSDRVDHVENTRCHVARHGERRFITPAAGA